MTIENKIKTIVKECIDEIVAEQKENRIRHIIKEQVRTALMKKALNEDEKDTGNKRLEMKRNAVMASLKKDYLNHAPLAYALYPSSDENEKATARSLFSKKATGTPDADGQIRHFSDEEVNKLYNIIRNVK